MNEAILTGKARYSVYYEDTDFSGYIYHANYLKFFDRAREDLIGLSYLRELFSRDLHFVVARLHVSFSRPGRHGDVVEVSTRMRFTGSPVTEVEQVASRVGADGSVEALVSATVKLAAVNTAGRMVDVPSEVLQHFSELATASSQS